MAVGRDLDRFNPRIGIRTTIRFSAGNDYAVRHCLRCVGLLGCIDNPVNRFFDNTYSDNGRYFGRIYVDCGTCNWLVVILWNSTEIGGKKEVEKARAILYVAFTCTTVFE